MNIYRLKKNRFLYRFASINASEFFNFGVLKNLSTNVFFRKNWRSSPEGSAPFLKLKTYQNLFSIKLTQENLVRSQTNCGFFHIFHSNVKKVRLRPLTKIFEIAAQRIRIMGPGRKLSTLFLPGGTLRENPPRRLRIGPLNN